MPCAVASGGTKRAIGLDPTRTKSAALAASRNEGPGKPDRFSLALMPQIGFEEYVEFFFG